MGIIVDMVDYYYNCNNYGLILSYLPSSYARLMESILVKLHSNIISMRGCLVNTRLYDIFSCFVLMLGITKFGYGCTLFLFCEYWLNCIRYVYALFHFS